MTRRMLVFEDRDADLLWLCRAVPRKWLERKLSFSAVPTRLGPVSLDLEPSEDLRKTTARITLASDAGPTLTPPIEPHPKPTIALRIRHPQRLRIASCQVSGGKCDEIDADRELVRLHLAAKTATVDLTFQP